MIPGKKYTPEDFVRIAWRRKWIILLPWVLVAVGTVGVARRLPNRYRAETLILVVPQRVPESYVRSTVTMRIEDRLPSISQQILSRTRLERVILDFDLYAAARKIGIMEDVVEQMRNDIAVDIVKGDAFRVAYIGSEPRTTMRVTERLASLFIDENLHDREVVAEGTNQFLEAQLDDARRRLIEHEKKLEAYRRRYSGQLPSQVESNLRAIENLQVHARAVVDSIEHERDRLAIVQRLIADVSASENAPRPAAVRVAGGDDANSASGQTAAQQLASATRALEDLQRRLKSDHPDVVHLKRVIRDLQQRADAEALARPLSPDSESLPSPGDTIRRDRLEELRAEARDLNQQIKRKEGEEQALRKSIAEYQARVEAAPARESELVELTRDYETLQRAYTTLLAKREESKIAANLERRQAGEQFKILDPPRLPGKPFSPDRGRINLLGALAGLMFGVAVTALLEYKDLTLRTDADVAATLALPVLASIPRMVTSAELRWKRKVFMLSFTTAATLVLFAALLIWKLGFLALRW